MKKSLAVLFGILFILQPFTPVFAAENPTATCGNASLVITNLPHDDRHVAIRINDKANGWNLEKPLEGDMATITIPRDGKYTFKATDKHTYDWWVHIENADGTYGSAIGGVVYCGAQSPTNFTATCKNNEISLSWKKVTAADHYAVRIDDAVNSWDAKNMLSGDRSENSVKDTKYTLPGSSGHGYNVWVHAVDTQGIFSPPTESFVSCKTGSGSSNFFSSISAFFRGLLPQ